MATRLLSAVNIMTQNFLAQIPLFFYLSFVTDWLCLLDEVGFLMLYFQMEMLRLLLIRKCHRIIQDMNLIFKSRLSPYIL